MLQFIFSLLAAIGVFFRDRSDTALEVLALRQQLAVLKRKRPRPVLNHIDRFFWTTLAGVWARWSDVLVIVKPETVVNWHRAGFRLYWRWRSRPRGGRPKITDEVRGLIRRLANDNPTWGAPRIHGELLKLGFDVSERTVARYLRRIRRRGDPGKTWLAFLNNHREVIVAFDFFTVPTLAFKSLYCFFVIEHGRRQILHFNITRHPSAESVLQQLREAFPEAGPYRYAVFDRDSKFNADVVTFLKATGLTPKQTSVQAPWQNGVSERWVGSCRRELLDRVIPLNEEHLCRLIREYVSYRHEDRIQRLVGEGHAESADGRTEAWSERGGALNSSYGWTASSVLLAPGGVVCWDPITPDLDPFDLAAGRVKERPAPGLFAISCSAVSAGAKIPIVPVENSPTPNQG